MSSKSTIPEGNVQPSDAARVLTKLRELISVGELQTDTLLGAIAVAAHSFSGADGAAIAMPRNGSVVCVGRSGNSAPELGTQLNIDSGISGECLRTGRILCCGDASQDFRVDPEACREMGIQSIGVVPLRGKQGRVGVLEVFSAESHAFTDDHLDLLGRLAGLAEAAWAREESSVTPAAEISKWEEWQADAAALQRVGDALATGLDAELAAERRLRHRILIALAAMLLLLLSVFAWKIWYRATVPSSSARPLRQLRPAPAHDPDGSAEPGPSAEAKVSGEPAAPAQTAPSPEASAEPRIPDTVIRRLPPPSEVHTSAPVSSGTPPSSVQAPDEMPQLTTPRVNPDELRSAASPAPVLPTLQAGIPQGTAGGLLVDRVQPTYPTEARRIGLEGTVVLDAFVTPRGAVEDIRLVSGPPLLAQAAIAAVGKWRYIPYVTDGKPVRKQTRITITFKLSR